MASSEGGHENKQKLGNVAAFHLLRCVLLTRVAAPLYNCLKSWGVYKYTHVCIMCNIIHSYTRQMPWLINNLCKAHHKVK